MAWVNRLSKSAPITGISQELVRFDTQKLESPEISGVEYQQGTLLGYEVREYLLEKWGVSVPTVAPPIRRWRSSIWCRVHAAARIASAI
ncbi:hypothetical protein HAALTHF_01050n [Vreelandella aquamarina]|nr:hypothetical protein HAALTHF_01050n [Halomonas axialensis]